MQGCHTLRMRPGGGRFRRPAGPRGRPSRPSRCRAAEFVSTLLLAAVFGRGCGPQQFLPPETCGGGACCRGVLPETLRQLLTGLAAPPLSTARTNAASSRGGRGGGRGGEQSGALPRHGRQEGPDAPPPRRRGRAKCWYPPAGAGAEASAPEAAASVPQAHPPSTSASTSGAGVSSSRLSRAAVPCGVSAPNSSVVSSAKACASLSDPGVELCANAAKWADGAVPTVPLEGAYDTAAARPAWPECLDPQLLCALWAAAGRPSLEEIMDLMEFCKPCGAWNETYLYAIENFIDHPWSTVSQEKICKYLGGCWSAAQMLSRLALKSLPEEQREEAISHVQHYLVVGPSLTGPFAALHAIAALCDVYRAAVGLERVAEALERLAQAAARAPPGRPDWEWPEGSGNCELHSSSPQTCIQLGCEEALADPPPEGIGPPPGTASHSRNE